MKIARFFPVFALLFAAATLSAQSYITAAGVRVNKGINFSVQQRILNKWTAEGIVHTSMASDELGITLLAERHHKILFKNLNLYYGAGPHFYFDQSANIGEGNFNTAVAGVSFIGGAELSLGRFNISADFKPELHLSGDTNFPLEWSGAAISVRYILIKPKKKRTFWDKVTGKNKDNKRRRR